MEEWHNRMKVSEQSLAFRDPICEAAYAFDDCALIFGSNEALNLYNCLVPKIKAHNYKFANCTNSVR